MIKAKSILLTSLVAVSLFFLSHLQAQGYEIKVKIPNAKDAKLILGHHFANATTLYPDDTIKLDSKGIGVFKRKKVLPGGMYIVFFPERKSYFDILLGDNQKFSFETDTFDFVRKTKFTGSIENQLFFDYQNYLEDKRILANKLNEKRKTAVGAEKDSLNKQLDRLTLHVKNYTQSLIANNPKTFVSTFLKSVQEIDVPPPPRDSNGNITDSLFQARYYKDHYFDNFDYSDQRLLRSPLYEQKVKTYFEKIIWQIPDSINKEIDRVLQRSKGNEEVFRYLLVTLYNMFASSQIMGMDAVYVHLGENYYLPYATWADSTFKGKLRKDIAHKKPNLIGKIAPDIKLVQLPVDHFMASKVDTALKSNPYLGNELSISKVKAKYLVLAFWEADCGHCKHVIPVLNDSVYPIIKAKGAEILAIHTMSSVEGKRKWIDFVNEHNMYGWINAWSPYSIDYKDLYDIYSTPVIYVLDENKRILAKRIDMKQIEGVIDFENRKNSNKQNNKL
jgi:hypothetical protein